MQYPQVTPTQVELWLQDPVTKALFSCLEQYQEDVRFEMGSGSCLDSSSADLTLSRMSQRMGQIEGLHSASSFEDLFNKFEMIEVASHVQAV